MDGGEQKSNGFLVQKSTTVTVSLLLLAQCAYVVFQVGAASTKLDGVIVTVNEIKSAQYTVKDAQRDLAELRREDEKITLRLRDLEVRTAETRAR